MGYNNVLCVHLRLGKGRRGGFQESIDMDTQEIPIQGPVKRGFYTSWDFHFIQPNTSLLFNTLPRKLLLLAFSASILDATRPTPSSANPLGE